MEAKENLIVRLSLCTMMEMNEGGTCYENILAISSRPRKGGNSDVLCDESLKGAAESGHEV